MTTEIDADRTAQTEGSSEARIDFSVWAHERARHFEWLAEKGLPQPGRDPKRLIGAMRYAVLGGGKRIRPLLCYAAGAVTGAPQPVLDGAALALECIHGYSLVHDDMPAMDNDTLRRGRPTVHVQYGEACAMLAGDALQTEAFSVLSKIDAAPEVVVRLLQTLSRASGVAGMAGGQAIDLELVGAHPDEGALLRMQSMKTGALIVAAVLMGAQSGRWEELSEASKGGLALYGHSLGIAFQVVDDILDCAHVKIRFGFLPTEGYNKLMNNYGDDPYILITPCNQTKAGYWGVYMTPREHALETDGIFSMLYIAPVHVPGAAGSPAEIIEHFKENLDVVNKRVEDVNARLATQWQQTADKVQLQ